MKEAPQHNGYQERRAEGRNTETDLTDILIAVLTGRAENELDTFVILDTWGDDIMKKIWLEILRKKKIVIVETKISLEGPKNRRERVGWNIGRLNPAQRQQEGETKNERKVTGRSVNSFIIITSQRKSGHREGTI